MIGANGQLGTDLVAALVPADEVIPLTRADVDIADAASVARVLDGARLDLVVNTAAYNRVDDAEEQFELALRSNAVGPQVLARACAAESVCLLHTSTDYVFSGARATPWLEDDYPRPANAYGVSKLAGELSVRLACPSSYVVRVSGLYGLAGSRGKGGNFVETMLRLQAEGKPIRVVNDQVLSPTPTRDLAEKLAEFIHARAPFGVYHMTAAGACSWYELARALFEMQELPVDLAPQSTAHAGFRAARPAYSVLGNGRLHRLGLNPLRSWHEGLASYLAARNASAR